MCRLYNGIVFGVNPVKSHVNVTGVNVHGKPRTGF